MRPDPARATCSHNITTQRPVKRLSATRSLVTDFGRNGKGGKTRMKIASTISNVGLSAEGNSLHVELEGPSFNSDEWERIGGKRTDTTWYAGKFSLTLPLTETVCRAFSVGREVEMNFRLVPLKDDI
jgi:hypothetical protein